ncbi:MAG: amidase [Saprospiraceae bacterium]|nr:amidase [Saprospiraceae bacterium]
MRSSILLLLLIVSCLTVRAQSKVAVDLQQASIEQLQQWMEEGNISSLQLVEYYLERIRKYDQAGPKLNAVLVINPEARSIARQMDRERRNGLIRSPMHGIPILIKDNINTSDKMPTTGGSLLLKDHFAGEDAFIVRKLREAGAVLLGKTNLSEWANFRSVNSSSGWSSLGGQTRNPHDTTITPCGSSSGSGVAVAADLCTIAIGTETDGSIACPAAVNGIVGIKPTVGLWSRSGIIPISHTQDTPGPMARCVMDAAVLLGICAGIDRKDSVTVRQNKVGDYTIFCQENTLRGSRLGVDTSFLSRNDRVSILFRQNLEKMKSAGAQIVPLKYTQLMRDMGDLEFNILLYEFKHDLALYLSQTALPFRTLSDLINANKEREEQIMPIFGQEIFLMAEEKGTLSDSAYLTALINCTRRSQSLIDSLMEVHHLSAIVGPALGAGWKIDHENGDKGSGPSAYSISSRAGYPSITIPSGELNGLPLAISFMAGAYNEDKLIGLAYDFEQKFNPELKVDF